MARIDIIQAPHYRRTDHVHVTDAADARHRKLNRIGIVLPLILAAILLGFTPMWLTSKAYKNQLNAVLTTLRPSVLQNDLATATINAHRGEFERSRQQASNFFTDLSAELKLKESSFNPGQVESIESILRQRDEIITLLARKDPMGANRLSDLYFQFTQIKNSSVPGSRNLDGPLPENAKS